MATQVETATTNGIKANGKIKSKNQLRRLKAKQKKAEEKTVKVCHALFLAATAPE